MKDVVMSLKDFEARIAKLPKEELERYLVELFKSSRQNQEAMTAALKGPEYDAALLSKFKTKLRKAYYGSNYDDRIFPDRAEKVLEEFKEICGVISPKLYIELGLYFATLLLQSLKDECYEAWDVAFTLEGLFRDLCKRVYSDFDLYQALKPKFFEVLKMESYDFDTDLSKSFEAIPWVKEEYPDNDYMEDVEW